LKVYQMNDYDWWADFSMEEAKKNYLKEFDYEDGDLDDVTELGKEGLEKNFFREDLDHYEITFQDRLKELEQEPQLFASTEY